MSGAMEDVLSLPVGGIQLGSSAPNSPMNANALPQPSSDGFAPSSPIEHTQKSIRERQNHSSNAFNYNDNGNQSQTFSLDIPPPWQNSAASHRLLNPPSKRPSNISLEQPRTKFMHTREPTTVQGYLERTLSDIAIMIAKVEQPLWRDGLITVLGNLHQLQQGNPIESSASLIANQCNRMEGILSKVTKSMSGNNTLHFQPLTTQNTPPTNSQQTPLEGGHTNLPQTSNNQQKGLYSSLFNDKSTHGSSRVIQPPKPSKKQLESKKKQQKRDKRLILIKESTESFENVNPLELRTNINAQFTADGHALSPVISTISKSMTKNLIITTTDDYSADLLIQNIDILAQHLKFKEAKRDTQFFKIVCHGVSLQFDRPDMPELIKNEITTFNKHLNLTIVGTPYWLTSEEKRRSGQRAGSLVIAFSTEEQARRARRERLNLGGTSVRTEELRSVLPTTQCSNCNGFGHLQQRCPKPTTCRFCAGRHHTRQHPCDICQTTGVPCLHTIYKCANCSESHAADNTDCDARPTSLC